MNVKDMAYTLPHKTIKWYTSFWIPKHPLFSSAPSRYTVYNSKCFAASWVLHTRKTSFKAVNRVPWVSQVKNTKTVLARLRKQGIHYTDQDVSLSCHNFINGRLKTLLRSRKIVPLSIAGIKLYSSSAMNHHRKKRTTVDISYWRADDTPSPGGNNCL